MSPIAELPFIVASNEELKYEGLFSSSSPPPSVCGWKRGGLIGHEITTFDSVALNNGNPKEVVVVGGSTEGEGSEEKAKSIINVTPPPHPTPTHTHTLFCPNVVNMISSSSFCQSNLNSTGETLLKFLYLRAETITAAWRFHKESSLTLA